jgi:hypothetical protein
VIDVFEPLGRTQRIELLGDEQTDVGDLKEAICSVTGQPVFKQGLFVAGQEDELRNGELLGGPLLVGMQHCFLMEKDCRAVGSCLLLAQTRGTTNVGSSQASSLSVVLLQSQPRGCLEHERRARISCCLPPVPASFFAPR